MVAPLYSYPDQTIGGVKQSLVLANFTLGTYSLTVGAESTATGSARAGQFQLDVFLVGDVNGDRVVTTTDGSAIGSRLGASAGQLAYKAEADINQDGQITSFDYTQWRTNINDRTYLNPLSLAIAGLSPDPVHLPGGSLLTNTSTLTLNGTATAYASNSQLNSLLLATGTDGAFDDGTTTGRGQRFVFVSAERQAGGSVKHGSSTSQ